MYFDLKKSQIYKAVRFSKFPNPSFLKIARVFSLAVGAICLVVYGIGKYSDLGISGEYFLGLSYVAISMGITMRLLEIYFHSYLKNPQTGQSENLADMLDYHSALALDGSAQSVPGVLSSLAKQKNDFDIFLRIGVDPRSLSQATHNIEKPTDESYEQYVALVAGADAIRQARGGTHITPGDLIAALFDFSDVFQKVVIDCGLDKNDLATLGEWHESTVEYLERKKQFWSLENLTVGTPIGIDWAYGYSRLLGQFTRDLTRLPMQSLEEEHLASRTQVIERMENILTKGGENNVLLVGEPGIGKKTVINTFAALVADGKTVAGLNYHRVLDLNLPAITSYAKEPSVLINLLSQLFHEAASAGNIILVMVDAHNYFGASGTLGAVDISQALLPYLESSRVRFIATTDAGHYHKYIESNAGLNKVFEKIQVKEPDIHETITILEQVVPVTEYKSGCFFTYGAIKNIVESADRYIQSAPFPEKAIELLNEVVGHARMKSRSGKRMLITADVVNETVTAKTNIPVGKISTDERQKLLSLETEMKKEIVGQEEAIQAVVRTMQRLRADVVKREKPAGVFLFVGPTGVGKTQTAKMLAKIYFGSADRMIRFDMSEYQDPQSIDRLIGSVRLNEPGQLASHVRDNPFSLILLDEIEKADKGILNIFLRVFDEGMMTDVFGRTVNFKQSIIIATSNAAAQLVRDMVNEGLDPAVKKENLMNALIGDGYFSPEFLNRFDEIVIYHPLNQEQILSVAGLLTNDLVARLKQQGYYFVPTPEVLEYISRIGFDPQYGARPMQRAIQDKIENVIAKKIIEGAIVKGVEFSVSLQDIQN